jgi:hypothetical protein
VQVREQAQERLGHGHVSSDPAGLRVHATRAASWDAAGLQVIVRYGFDDAMTCTRVFIVRRDIYASMG